MDCDTVPAGKTISPNCIDHKVCKLDLCLYNSHFHRNTSIMTLYAKICNYISAVGLQIFVVENSL